MDEETNTPAEVQVEEAKEEPAEKIEVEELPDEQPEQSNTVPDIPISSLGSLELVRYFGIEYPTTEEKQQLNDIWEYARRMQPNGGLEDVISEVLRLKRVVGTPRLGEAYIDRVYRYVKLRKQERLIQEEIRDVQGSAHL